jgi:hypothetical protein
VCDYEKHSDSGEGDIHASYSADTIATEGKIRRPFMFNGNPWVCVGMRGRGAVDEAEAYRLVHVKIFKGTPTTYSEKTRTEQGAEIARTDPLGFYHAMVVKSGKESFVMMGPPTTFVSDPVPEGPVNSVGQSEQLSLFPKALEPR